MRPPCTAETTRLLLEQLLAALLPRTGRQQLHAAPAVALRRSVAQAGLPTAPKPSPLPDCAGGRALLAVRQQALPDPRDSGCPPWHLAEATRCRSPTGSFSSYSTSSPGPGARDGRPQATSGSSSSSGTTPPPAAPATANAAVAPGGSGTDKAGPASPKAPAHVTAAEVVAKAQEAATSALAVLVQSLSAHLNHLTGYNAIERLRTQARRAGWARACRSVKGWGWGVG